MKKTLGNENKQARESAVVVLAQFKGVKISDLKTNEVKDVLAAVMKLLGLVDKDGNIK